MIWFANLQNILILFVKPVHVPVNQHHKTLVSTTGCFPHFLISFSPRPALSEKRQKLTTNLEKQPWQPTLTNNFDKQPWRPSLTTNLEDQHWWPTLTTNFDDQPWQPTLTTNLDNLPTLGWEPSWLTKKEFVTFLLVSVPPPDPQSVGNPRE